jgi:hypothetical protein
MGSGRWTAALVLVAACATQKQMLDQGQDEAVQTALTRGRFELNCPEATATVLSRDFIQPADDVRRDMPGRHRNVLCGEPGRPTVEGGRRRCDVGT